MELKEINNKIIFPRDLFVIGEEYSKKDISFISNKNIYNSSGVVSCLNTLLLFVTLDKTGKPDDELVQGEGYIVTDRNSLLEKLKNMDK